MLRRALSTSSTNSDMSLPLSSPSSLDTQYPSRKSERYGDDRIVQFISWRMTCIVMMMTTIGFKLKHDSLHSHYEYHRQTMSETHERVSLEIEDLLHTKKTAERGFHETKDTLKAHERRSEGHFKEKISLSREKRALELEIEIENNNTLAMVTEYEHRLRLMERKLELWKEQGNDNEESVKEANRLVSINEKLKKREEAMKANTALLQSRIQRESHREVVERFGHGPHYVEFKVRLPLQNAIKKFIVKMASVESMPHAVHLFLEQVHHKLWDGCSFTTNDVHALTGSPLPVGDSTEDKFTPFVESELDALTFQEYSAEHPHLKYTLGFNGRPGGSHFYVNTMDNVADHGPGGQDHHDLEEEADPCFGKVVTGMNVIDEMSALPTNAENRSLVDRVLIHSMRILSFD